MVCPFPNSKLGKVKFFQRARTVILKYVTGGGGGTWHNMPPPSQHLNLFNIWSAFVHNASLSNVKICSTLEFAWHQTVFKMRKGEKVNTTTEIYQRENWFNIRQAHQMNLSTFLQLPVSPSAWRDPTKERVRKVKSNLSDIRQGSGTTILKFVNIWTRGSETYFDWQKHRYIQLVWILSIHISLTLKIIGWANK